MGRLGVLIWLCCGALGLGIVVLSANRRQVPVSKVWYFTAFLLGPIFLLFVLPLWLGNGVNPKNNLHAGSLCGRFRRISLQQKESHVVFVAWILHEGSFVVV